MSGFIATGTPATAAPLDNGPFWPAVDLNDLRGALRIDASVTDARLELAAVSAMLTVNAELSAWRLSQEAQGHATLADVPAESIKGKTRYQHLYRRAVYAATAAEVCERYKSYDTTAHGDRALDAEQSTVDDYRRDQRFAIRDFLGRSRTAVELL